MKSTGQTILKIILLVCCILLTTRAEAYDPKMQDAVCRFIHASGIDSLSTAVAIVDLKDGNVAASANDEKLLIPASILKTLTTATVSNISKISDTFDTEIYYDGTVSDSTLQGNLIFIGSGDPTLNSKHFPNHPDIVAEIVNALDDKGIKTIAGRLIMDQSIFPEPATPPSWDKADLPHYYGTGTHGINFEDNSAGKSSVSNPSAKLAAKLASAMAIKGIGMENKALPQSSRTLLLNHKSPTLEDIMRSCMMRSDNLYAEALLRSVAVKRGMEGSTSKAIKSERDFWRKRGLDLSDIEIHDGSGLSRSNRITASFLANVLYYMSSDAEYASYFPLAGAEGTLKKFLADTELECYIALKTGSMNGIQCYAGYKVDEDFAPTYAVVIIGNNIGNRSNFRSHTQKMLLEAFTDNTPTE